MLFWPFIPSTPNGVQDLLSVLYPSGHFILLYLQDVGQCLVGLLALLAREEHGLAGSMQQDLTVVKEVDLEQLVAQSKHDCVPSF